MNEPIESIEMKIMSLMQEISSDVFDFGFVGALHIYDSYLQIPPRLKGKDKRDFYMSFINEAPKDALFRLSLEGDKNFEFIVDSYLRMGSKRGGWGYKKLDINIRARERWIMIFQALTLLKEKGKLLTIVEPAFWISKEGKTFRGEINKKGFFINAVIQFPQNSLEMTSVRPYIILLSREKTKRLFIADLGDGFNITKIAKNYKNNKSKNLYEGLFLKEGDFKGFDRYKAEKEFELLAKQYNKYRKVLFQDLIKDYKLKDFDEDPESIYLRMAGNFKVVDYKDITKNKYIQLKLDIKKVNPSYLRFFLNSEVGNNYLNSLGDGHVIKYLQSKELLESEIYLLPLNLQKKTVDIMSKINSLSFKLNDFEEKVLHDPDSSSDVTAELNKVMESLETLSEEEELLSVLRGGETQQVEFKQTLSKNMKTKQKDKEMEKMVLKTICGFLNTNGGTLFVGVDDNGEIYGIDKDVYPNNDKYLLHFKNLLKDQIGAEFFPLINYEIKKLLDKEVLIVRCEMSKKPVFLGKEAFYVRSNPATDELKGEEQYDYIENHFKK